jgi:predicted nucleic-acid-binding protein
LRITADTNVLLRAVLQDDPEEGRVAAALLRRAELIAVPLPVLCEFVWVLARSYRRPPGDIAAAIRRLIDDARVAVDRPAVDAGLSVLEAGGDFADAIIAFEGARLGGEVFATFDVQAAAVLRKGGGKVRRLAKRRDPAKR